jgi:ATP-dependent DNA helicase RecG
MLLKDFVPFPKNPNIAQFFTQMGRSEELGTGIRKVYKYSKEYSGSDDIEFLEEDVFTTKVPLGNIFTIKDNSDKVPDKITDNQTKLLELISESPTISMSDLATKIGISKRKILDNINKLKQMGFVERIGPAKGGYWNIMKH